MMARGAGYVLLSLAACLAGAGCVEPGRIEPELVRRYQQWLRSHSPQVRAGNEGLDALRPLTGRELLPLKANVQSGELLFELPVGKGKGNMALWQKDSNEFVQGKMNQLLARFASGGPADLERLTIRYRNWEIDVSPRPAAGRAKVVFRAVGEGLLARRLEAAEQKQVLGRAVPRPKGLPRRPDAAVQVLDVSIAEALRLMARTNEFAAKLRKVRRDGDAGRSVNANKVLNTPLSQLRDVTIDEPQELVIRFKDWWFSVRAWWLRSDPRLSLYKRALRLYVEAKDAPMLEGKLAALQPLLGKRWGRGRPSGAGTKVLYVSLPDAIRLALMNSLDIRVVSFDPAIAREEVVKAAAEFDYTVFASFSHQLEDKRAASALLSSQSRTTPLELGVQKKTILGTELKATYDLTRTKDSLDTTVPEPRDEALFTVELVQPLLKFGGTEYNLASLRIARLGHGISLAQFREQVEKTVTDVQSAYWALVQAQEDYQIQERLLDVTIQTCNTIRARSAVDATQVQIKQTRAAVASRRAALMRARKNVLDAQYVLARLLADPRAPLFGEYTLRPSTAPVDTEVTLDPTDQLTLALKHNPTLEQARLAIRAADISVQVARNETLPELDLSASVTFQGLRGSASRANLEMLTLDYFSHTVAVKFEYPLGNRAARAELRKKQFERLKAITTFQNAADQVAVAVGEAIRQIRTTYQELQAQRAAKAAAKLELQALEDTENLRGRRTPEFLQLKLSAQETLAQAERAELQAVIGYNNALADLARVAGTTLHQHNIKLAAESAIRGRPLRSTLPASRPATSMPGTRPKASPAAGRKSSS